MSTISGLEVGIREVTTYHKVKFRLWNYLDRPTLDPDVWMKRFLAVMRYNPSQSKVCWTWFQRLVRAEGGESLAPPLTMEEIIRKVVLELRKLESKLGI
jgi:hypothetical protein